MAEQPRRIERIFMALAVVHALGVVVATLWLHLLGDRQPVGLFLVYGPRWPALLVGIVLLLAGLALRAWRGVALTAVATAIVFFAYLDFNLPTSFGAEGKPLRIVTYNIQERELTAPWLGELLATEEPDVLALVECRPPEELTPPEPYHFDKSYGLCLFSRFPITAVDARDQTDAFERGGKAAITIFTLEPPEAPSFQVMVVHLASPRGAIEALLHERLDGFEAANENMRLRDWEASLAHEWLARADRPTLVVGDFNLAEESAIFQRHFGHLEDAFSSCGLGFGNTKHTRKFGSRIDHILMSEAFACVEARVIDLPGSDHLPLSATVVLGQ